MSTFGEVEAPLHLLGEAPRTIMGSEQSHGRLAAQRRVHRFVSAAVLATRAYLHMARAVVRKPQEAIVVRRLQGQVVVT